MSGPPGGPEDKIPPVILNVKPQEGSVNVSRNIKFEVRFSKNMDKTSAENSVFISPLFFNYPKYEWSGKTLTIIPPEKLRENTTYVLTIGAQARDTRRNEMGKSMSYPFSTGDEIYDCSIYGEVLGRDMQKLNIWAYKLDSSNPGMFWKDLPDYVTQPDSLGRFEFEYLSFGHYLVVAVEDKNSDQFWAPPGERLALPDKLVYLHEQKREFGPLVMMTTERDTIQPYIAKVRSFDSHSINITFSQPIDSALALQAQSYMIYPPDSIENIAIIKDVMPLGFDSKSFYLRCDNLTEIAKYKVLTRRLQSPYGIPADTVSKFTGIGGADTLRPEILSFKPEPSRNMIPKGFDITILFSEPIDTSGFGNKLSFADSSENNIEFDYNWLFPNIIIITPKFEDGNEYKFSYDERVIFDLMGNSLGDSLKEYTYRTAEVDSFGQVLGRIANAPEANVYAIVESKAGEEVSRNKVAEDGSFYIDRLLSGVYKLRAYADINENEKFDGGNIEPFEFSEPIALYPDTIKVRARWETDIGALDFRPQRIDVDTLQ